MKKPKTAAQVVDDLLATVPAPKSNAVIASMPELAAAIKRFLELKAVGDPRAHVSLAWFYNNKLREQYNGPSMDAVRRHVRDVLHLDVTTGKKL
jgi:hypothetical protein